MSTIHALLIMYLCLSVAISLPALTPLPINVLLFASGLPVPYNIFGSNYNLSVESVITSSSVALIAFGVYPTAWLILDSANHRKELTALWIWCPLLWSWITIPVWLIKRDEASGETQSKFWKLFSYLSISAFIVRLAQQLYSGYICTLGPYPSAVTASGFFDAKTTIDIQAAIYMAFVSALYCLPLIFALSFTFGFRIQAKETSSENSSE